MNLIAIDIGAYSIKAIVLDPKRKYAPVAFFEERIEARVEPPSAAPAEERVAAPRDAAEADDPTGEWGAPEDLIEEEPAPLEGGETLDEADFQDELLAPWQLALQQILLRAAEVEGDGDGVLLTLPHGKSFSVQIPELPFPDKAKVGQILPGMLATKLPFGLDELVYDFFVSTRVESAGAQPEAIVGVARKRDLRQFLDELDIVNANPALVGIPELTLRYLAETYVAEYETGSFALMDMGHERTLIHVIERGRTVMARAINHGGHEVTEAIAQTFRASHEDALKVKHARGAILDASQAQDPSLKALSDAISSAFAPLVRDLRRTFQALYARERVEIEKIYVFGGNSRIANLEQHLTEQLGVSVVRLSLEGRLEPAEPLPAEATAKGHTALATALQVVRDRMNTRGVNLRQGAFTYRGKSSYLRSQLTRFAVVAGVLLMLLVVALYMQKRDLNAQRDAMRAAVAQETKKVFGAPLYKADAIKKRAESEGGTEGGGFVPKMSAYEVFYRLSSQVRPDITLTLSRVEVDADRNLIQLYGKTTTPQAVDDIVSDLEQIECLKSIKKDKLQVRKEDEVDFELQISSGCS